ncbi:metallophosphoesterase family protein, partial [Salinispira pacifica]
MVRILHTADLHLGMKFAGYPQVRDRLSAARFDALDRIVESANREQCSLLTIGGDLFDRPRVGAAEVERAAESLSRFEGEAVLVLPGNHDYVAPESELWTRFRRAAGDRTILLDRPEPVDLRPFGPSAALYPAPCTARRSAVNNIGWIAPDSLLEGVDLHIGIAHGSLQGLSPDPELNYYPMSREELLSRPVDLWLL